MNITFICEIVITSISILLTAWVIPYLINKYGIDKVTSAYEIIKILVNSVEQITKQAGVGEEKKAWVIDKLYESYNITLDEEVVSELIESAVHEMNIAIKK